MVPLSTLLPDGATFLSLVAVLLACLCASGIGMALCRRGSVPELGFFSGWGAMIGWAVPFGMPGGPLYAALGMVAALALALGVRGGHPLALRKLGEMFLPLLRTLLVGAPLLFVMIGMQLWGDDGFSFWLPNLDYLRAHHALPTAQSYPAFSHFPMLPYGYPLLGYAASLLGAGDLALVQINLFLTLLAACLFARLVAGLPSFPSLGATPRWRDHLLGWLLAVWLNPGFVPAIWWTGSADLATGLALLAALLAAFQERKEKEFLNIEAAAALVLLVSLKQPNLVLALGWFLAMLAACGVRTVSLRASFMAHGRTLLPALIIWAAWESHVRLQHGLGLRHQLLAADQWQWRALGGTLARMGEVALHKGGQFGMYAALFGLLFWALRQKRRDAATAWLAGAAVLILWYNAFLAVIYSTYYVGGQAPSFWRYNTHLSLVALTALLPWGAAICACIPKRWAQVIFAVLLLAWVILPFAVRPHLRFDLKPPAPAIRMIGGEIGRMLPPGASLEILSYGERKESYFLSFRGTIRLANKSVSIPRTYRTEETLSTLPPGIHLLTLCKPAGLPAPGGEGEIALFRREAGARDRLLAHWPKPPGMRCGARP